MYQLNGEALQLCAVYKMPYFLVKLTQESMSSTASYTHCVWTYNEIEEETIITIVATKL